MKCYPKKIISEKVNEVVHTIQFKQLIKSFKTLLKYRL